MTIVGLEIQHGHTDDIEDFLDIVADDILDGNGAGNCTPDSIAFWTLDYLPDPNPDWMIVTITLHGDDLSESEIATAVRKVTSAPSGDIIVFGNVVGSWETSNQPVGAA